MLTLNLLTVAAYAAAMVVTLALAAYLTPAHWWRQLNARALSVVAIGGEDVTGWASSLWLRRADESRR